MPRDGVHVYAIRAGQNVADRDRVHVPRLAAGSLADALVLVDPALVVVRPLCSLALAARQIRA